MIGIDTNVLVRYLTQDDPVQARKATELIESLSEARPGFITVVVMAELAWVLERSYRLGPPAIAACIERILQANVLVVENEQQAFAGMFALKKGQGSFADALIAALGSKAGCVNTVTFDRKALRLPGYAAV